MKAKANSVPMMIIVFGTSSINILIELNLVFFLMRNPIPPIPTLNSIHIMYDKDISDIFM